MNRLLTPLICLVLSPLFQVPALAQEEIPISTFTITGLRDDVRSLSLPSAARANLDNWLDRAEEDYRRGSNEDAITALDGFRLAVESQPEVLIPPASGNDLLALALRVADALGEGYSLGGGQAGPAGLILDVADQNSPLYRTRLLIPPGAVSRETFVSLSVGTLTPRNRALTFPGPEVVLSPPGLALAEPATLELPYGDEDGDGVVDGTDYPARFLKAGVFDSAGRIAFPRRELDATRRVQRIEIYDFAAYRNVAWRWTQSVLTYSFAWPEEGVALASNVGMTDLAEAVRRALEVWSSVLVPAGVRFEEVPPNQPAAVRFGFFSPDVPLRVLDASAPTGALTRGLGRGLGDGAAQVYARENPLETGEGFAVIFNGDFGRSGDDALAWTSGLAGDPNEVSIESVAVHALGHVMGLDDVPDMLQPPVMATGADLLKPEVCLAFEDIAALYDLYGIDPSLLLPCPHARLGGLSEFFSFGQVPLDTEREAELSFQNVGTGTLLIGSVSVDGIFEVDTSQMRRVLPAGEATRLVVRFPPGVVGPQEGSVRIATNASRGPVTVRLTGSHREDMPGCTLMPSPLRVSSGELTTLRWTVSGSADSAEVSPGVGGVDLAAGGVEIRPEATTRYTLTVSGSAGTGTCGTTVVVEPARSSEIIWTRQLGGGGDDSARALATADFGILVGGELGGSSGAGGGAVLALYDTAGERIWEQFVGGSRIEGLALDETGIYAAGFTERAMRGEEHRGGMDAFVGKFDLEGNMVWIDQFGTTGMDRASGVALDSSGVYVVGVTDGTLDNVSSGGVDVVVRKYSLDGSVLWVRQFGTSGDDSARGVAALPEGIVVVGDTGAALPGQTFGGGSDAFLRRYEPDGTEVWTRQFGGPGNQTIAAVTADTTGIYAAGGTETALPGQASLGGFDAFLRRYGHDGREVWTRQFGTAEGDSAAALDVDATGLFVAVATEGTMRGHVSEGGADAFVRALDFAGDEIWTRYVGTSQVDEPFALAASDVGVYVAGSTLGTFRGAASNGARDGYLTKIRK